MRRLTLEHLERRNLLSTIGPPTPLDVNHDGLITAADVGCVVNSINAGEGVYVPLNALAIINDLNLNGSRPVLSVTLLAANTRPAVGQQQIAVARLTAIEPTDVQQVTLRLDQHGIGINPLGTWTMNGEAADAFRRGADNVAEFRWGGDYSWMPPIMRVEAAVDLVFSGTIVDESGWMNVEVTT